MPEETYTGSYPSGNPYAEDSIYGLEWFIEEHLKNTEYGGSFVDATKNPNHLVIYVFQQSDIEKIAQQYTGRQFPIDYLEAKYSVQQIYDLKDEIKNNAIMDYIFNVSYYFEKNGLKLEVEGEENKTRVEEFIVNHPNKDCLYITKPEVNPG